MLRFLFLRLILPLLLLLLVRYLIKMLLSTSSAQASRKGSTRRAGEFKQDPVCGTYVAPGAAVEKTVRGQTMYFCSDACRDKYVA